MRATNPHAAHVPIGRSPWCLARFPVSSIFVATYGSLVLAPAALFAEEDLSFSLALVGLAVGSAFVVEALLLPLRAQNNWLGVGRPFVQAATITTIGAIAVAGSSFGGSRSFSVQLGYTEISWWIAFLTPFNVWLLFGSIMLLYCTVVNPGRRVFCLQMVIATCLLQFAVGLRNGLVNAAASYTLTLLLVAVILGLLTVRRSILFVGAMLLLWPVIHEARDAVRYAVLGQSLGPTSTDPFERLRFDKQMANAELLVGGPGQLDVPSWLTVVRTGLLPSLIDSPRPPLNTGSVMSVALGGSPRNSTSATFLGNVAIFDGAGGLIVVGGVLSLVMVVLLRRRGVWDICMFGLIYYSLMSLVATYPDGIASVLQGILSLLVVLVVVSLMSAWSRSNQEGAVKSDPSVSAREQPPQGA